ncbi:MAG: cysteine desulfurase [Planctomycetes bacterium]|nr:cysteine desulfurase [Planctomycetota bacterium]
MIYLDNAATSFPKPEAVYSAVDHYQRSNGAPVGRGAYNATLDVTASVHRCRKQIADLLGAQSPEQIVFTFNCTDSLNLVLHGLLQPGDHVVTSQIEHNSVLRPLSTLQHSRHIQVTQVPADSNGKVDPFQFRQALQANTKLVALMHASNVTGTIQPIHEVGELAHRAGALFLVDGAQTAGQLPIQLRDAPIDLFAFAGHKGLLGPLGTGGLYLRPGVEERVASLRQGGTGTHSEDDVQPSSLPDKYESGNHNAPGLVGLEAGVSWLLGRGVESVHRQEQELILQLLEGLAEIPNLRQLGPCSAADRVGVVSITIPDYEPQAVAAILDQSFGIAVRAGLHCAPGAHRALGSLESGGTVRISVGPFTTAAEIDAVVAALSQIAATA